MKLLQKSRYFVDGLNELMNDLRELPDAVRGKDPAAKSNLEVLLLYPGVKAVFLHRFSHAFWKMDAKFSARLLSEFGRFVTGIEIHPGAELGRRVVIDHGMGTVIGETAIVGDDVLLYQNVTLGSARSRDGRRHPIIERGAVIGAGATVMGPVVVGQESKVGAGAVVARNVEANSVVTGIPASPKKPRALNESQLSTTLPLRRSDSSQKRSRHGQP